MSMFIKTRKKMQQQTFDQQDNNDVDIPQIHLDEMLADMNLEESENQMDS